MLPRFSVKTMLNILGSNLCWKFHIDNVALKVSRTVGVVARLGHFVPRTTLLNIYQSLILSYLTYGLAAWGQAAKTHLKKILVLQKRVLRLMNFSEPVKNSTLTNVTCWKIIFYNV